MTTNLQIKKTIVIPKANNAMVKNELKTCTSNSLTNNYSTNSLVNNKQTSLGKNSKIIYQKPPTKRENDENCNTQNLQLPRNGNGAKFDRVHSFKSGSTNTSINFNSTNYNSLNNSTKIVINSVEPNKKDKNAKSQTKDSESKSQKSTKNETSRSIKVDLISAFNKPKDSIPVHSTKNLIENINKTTLINSNVDDDSLNLKNYHINKSLLNDFTQDEYRKMETLFVRENHNSDNLSSLLKEEKTKPSSLNKHKINERMRMRMVDWMIEVINNYKCDESVFFLAVDLMDSYFELSSKPMDPSELHLLGVASMFTASKFQDIYPLRLKMVHEKIAHKKLSVEEIKAKEYELLTMNDFEISGPTIWDFILLFIEEIFVTEENKFHINSERLNEKIENFSLIKKRSAAFSTKLDLKSEGKCFKSIFKTYTPNMVNLLKHVALYLAKMNLHDYSLAVDNKPSLLAASTVFVSLKICEQINKVEYLTDCFIKKLCDLSKSSENSIIKIAQKILGNAQNFDSVFSGLENLKKVHFNAIIELKNTK